MPAKSKAQQMAAGAALAAKRGETRKSDLKGASKEMYESMTEKELRSLPRPSKRASPTTSPATTERPSSSGPHCRARPPGGERAPGRREHYAACRIPS